MYTVLSVVDRDVLDVLLRLELNKYASPTEGFKREYHCAVTCFATYFNILCLIVYTCMYKHLFLVEGELNPQTRFVF